MKVAMIISYDGSYFNGYQSQTNKSGINDFLIEKFASVGIFSKISASGRTDKGVHANSQVISLTIPHFHENINNLQNILNKKLYPKVKIKKIIKVDNNFDARFSAKKRSYCYILSPKFSPFISRFSHLYTIKDIDKFKSALKLFEGTHDFSNFMKKGGSGEKTQIRTIYKTRLIKINGFYIIYFIGNAFLRSQIRLMVGFLLEIDNNNQELKLLNRCLDGKNKFTSNITPAPPNGLFLNKVYY